MQISKYLILFTLLNLVFTQSNYSQELKTYKGKYKEGNAEYQYYENENFERVLNGSFKYSEKSAIIYMNNDPYLIQTSESGNFINNKKNGEWIFKAIIISKKLKVDVNDIFLSIKGKYENDKKSGKWNSSHFNIFLGTGKINKLHGSTDFSFLNDTVIGKIDNLENIKGDIDSKGNFVGDWIFLEKDREFKVSFKDNFLIKLIDRKVSTGEIYAKYISNLDLTNFKEYIKNYEKLPYDSNKIKYHNSILNIAGLPKYDENNNDYRSGIIYSLSDMMSYLKKNISVLFSPYVETLGSNFMKFKYLNGYLLLKSPEILINNSVGK